MSHPASQDIQQIFVFAIVAVAFWAVGRRLWSQILAFRNRPRPAENDRVSKIAPHADGIAFDSTADQASSASETSSFGALNMPVFPLYLGALLMGLAGGFAHCIGMCGIFVVSYTGMPGKEAQNNGRHPERHVMFHLGRLCSLTTLGLLGGLIGLLGHRWVTLQGMISLSVGVVMLGLALGLAGVLPRFKLPEPDVMGAGGGTIRRLFLRALQSRTILRPLLIGLFVGLLPCGLTYTALIGTFALPPLPGALLMFLFGLGTVPGLLTLALFGNRLFGGLLTRVGFRTRMTQVAAALMAVLAVAFVWRGVTNL